MANAVILQAPLLVYAAHPANMLANPTVDVLKNIPTVWDETVVLPVSEIREVAAFARRSGETWFLAMANGSRRGTSMSIRQVSGARGRRAGAGAATMRRWCATQGKRRR